MSFLPIISSSTASHKILYACKKLIQCSSSVYNFLFLWNFSPLCSVFGVLMVFRSSESIRKTQGPNQVSCGISRLRVVQSDVTAAIFTRCRRFNRNECIHFNRRGLMSNAAVFLRTDEWSTWANALL
jgi:hypothetical protein